MRELKPRSQDRDSHDCIATYTVMHAVISSNKLKKILNLSTAYQGTIASIILCHHFEQHIQLKSSPHTHP